MTVLHTTQRRSWAEAGKDRPGTPLLEIQGVRRRFVTDRTDTLALTDVNLTVQPGAFICIVGPSGCGKSTLLNLVAGLDFPTEGTVAFDGAPVAGPSAECVVVFQEPALYPWLNVRANVEFGLKLKGVPEEERRETADYYLEMVHLRRFERSYIHELSGGMKQRAQLARALAVHPRMLLMDEPFAALDAQTRDTLQGELQEVWQRTGATILFVTHNVSEAAMLADRVYVMGANPGHIRQAIDVPLPRPRFPDTHQVTDYALQIREALSNDYRI